MKIIEKRKMGRPKTENPKYIKYSIRIDVETERKLKDYCTIHNITKGEAFRRGINHLLNEEKNFI